jgi:hypothetical protein
MGRRWLGVSKRDYLRMPHAESWPESLWWYVGESATNRNKIIDAYIERYAKGRAIPDGFSDELRTFLKDLGQIQTLTAWKKPRTKRYWTIPDYARAHGIRPHTLMKRLRELENVAKGVWPGRAEKYGRRDLKRDPLTEKEIEAIRSEYLKGIDAKQIAQDFRLSAAHVGKLCSAERIVRRNFGSSS